MSWKPLPLKEWRKFKAERLKKWLEPVELDEDIYKEADERYENFMRYKKLMAELLKKTGLEIDEWELKEDPERKAGWRAQKWFSEMLFDLQVVHTPEFKLPHLSEQFFKVDLEQLGLSINDWRTLYYSLGIGPDINIHNFGTIEVKNMKLGTEIFNVKKNAWDQNPSLYLTVLRTCDESMLTFQFVGWLSGMQVYGLKVQSKIYGVYSKSHYFGKPKELRKPESFLRMLFGISRANPSSGKRERRLSRELKR
jgi:hypothetical protein